MRTRSSLLVGLAAWLVPAAALAGPLAHPGEVPIELSELPAAVRAAAESALPGIELTEAETDGPASARRYEVEGDVEGVSYEIQITPEGRVMSIEEDD